VTEAVLITNEDVDHSQATTIFVLGLISVIMCNVLGPVALYLGNKYRQECAAAGVNPEGLGTAGWVLGIVGTVILILTAVFLLVYFACVCVFFIVYIVLVILIMMVTIAA
jgi:hypothetical protein